MRRFLALAISILFLHISYAQFPGGQRTGGGQAPTGRFYGKIVDPNNRGVEAASVTLVSSRMDSVTKKPKDVIIGGMLTAGNGEFSIENVPLMGRYKLKITGIGFKAYEQNVAFEMPNRTGTNDPMSMLGALDKDLGNIKIQIDEQVLGGVTVTANKPQLGMAVVLLSFWQYLLHQCFVFHLHFLHAVAGNGMCRNQLLQCMFAVACYIHYFLLYKAGNDALALVWQTVIKYTDFKGIINQCLQHI
jgi:hypothetical protein